MKCSRGCLETYLGRCFLGGRDSGSVLSFDISAVGLLGITGASRVAGIATRVCKAGAFLPRGRGPFAGVVGGGLALRETEGPRGEGASNSFFARGRYPDYKTGFLPGRGKYYSCYNCALCRSDVG